MGLLKRIEKKKPDVLQANSGSRICMKSNHLEGSTRMDITHYTSTSR